MIPGRLSLALLCLISSFHVLVTFAFRHSNHPRRLAGLSPTKLTRNGRLTSLSMVFEGIDLPNIDLNPLLEQTSSTFTSLYQDLDQYLTSGRIVGDITNIIDAVAANPLSIPIWTLFVIILIIGGLGSDDANVGSPYDAGETKYNYKIAEEYFGKKPLFVFRRLLRLAQVTGAFNTKLALDFAFKTVDKNMKSRAKEALKLSTQLGPTFIKLGQALSIRTDLIPEPYALELRQLQDAVPPFDNAEAMKILCKELGISELKDTFRSITDKPIASASIGQVYKATLRDNREVAVKIQRPNIIREIALDLYILRLLTPLQVKLSNAINKRKTNPGDIDVALSLVDEWGRGFVAEVDYLLEAKNGKEFSLAMEKRGLNAVTAPKVVDELSGRRVLVSEWMDGTRLDKDASPDVPRLCGVAVNAYLTMLLDTGVLHCDPHPGNLLRTRDGRLCILDWGMTLRVPQDLQYALLEFIAHVNTEDYDAIPNDFVNLGFSPANQQEKLRSSGISEGLAFTFRQLSKGGGPKKIQERVKAEFQERYGADLSDEELRKKAREEMISRMEKQLKDEGINVNGVTEVMETMSRRNRELFKLPPYVLYVSRAFSTLEGIGLSLDENYSILQECYPYLARRLFTDNSPRAKAALRTMLFGSSAALSSSSDTMLSSNKFLEMASGFTSYTASTVTADRDGQGAVEAQEALIDLVLSMDGSAVQEILIEGLAEVTDAVIREQISSIRKSSIAQSFESLLKQSADTTTRFLPQPLAEPLLLPYRLSQSLIKISEKTEEDERSLRVLQSLARFLNLGSADGEQLNVSQDRIQLVQQLSRQLQDPQSNLRKILADRNVQKRFPALVTITRKYAATLMHRAADRVEKTSLQSQRVVNLPSPRQAVGSRARSAVAVSSNSENRDERILRSVSKVVSQSARNAAKLLTPVTKKRNDDENF
jgi:predicted unusual protein kinase regulating ubiquinone biosynthesis (AarF/ABC1/UbiB family)